MNIKIQNSGADGASNTKGSCSDLAHYIDHEDKDRLEAGLEPLPYTTPDGDEVTTEEVIAAIDANAKGLSRSADKFFHLVVSPSQDEIRAMGNTDEEIYESGLKLIKAISDAYAENFHRDGLLDSTGLELYWKPHFTRGNDGNLQFHIHGVVSRKTKRLEGLGGKHLKISPVTNHKDTTKGAVQGGFDRTAFARCCEKLFDKLFEYNRKVAETFDYQNAMKHGSVEEKAEQTERLVAENAEELRASISAGIGRRRKNLSNKRDIDEIAAMLESGMTLPASKGDAMKAALNTAEIKTVIMKHFSSETNATMLELHLIGEGITFTVIMAKEGGVEDLLFFKAGQKMSAKDMMSAQDHRQLLSHWQRLSGQIPAFILREQRAQEEREREISQRKLGGPKMRR
ncbi:MAG: hypothetical protein J6N46_08590 [Bacteroidales bacterium]|nr:hypothetical protein [Bacteroidales bacterium]